jgi:DNA-binding CsgD family transcriptional regulator/tetratricopeptide (TPR) repeat protein
MSRVGIRVSSPAFVGRGEQLDALRAALLRAEAGEAGAVVISGESGVGKTRLVGEFGRAVRACEGQFLVGGCVDVGGSELPYAPLLGVLRSLVRDTDPGQLEELIGAGGGELGRLLPELQGDGARIEAVDPLAQARLFEALLGLFARAGRELPVVLVIEDLHWADPSTRGFLSFLVRNMGRERLLLVATYRSDELHRRHPLRQFVAEVERLPVVRRLELAPFTRRELAEQLAAILDALPDDALVAELFARSQGNPFFAEELLAASGEGGPQRIPRSLHDALMLRVERLSSQARQMARAAAVAGSVVGHRLLEATGGLSDDELTRALREAIENNVLVQDPASESYAFRHELLREALYEELLPGERVALHAALARALESNPGLAVGAHGAAAQCSTHWSAAHEPARALAASVQAGVEAERVWSFEEANAHFEHAVEVWAGVAADQRPDGPSLTQLIGRAAEAAYLSGQNHRAVTLTHSALEAIDVEGEPEAAGLAHERLGRYLLADFVLPDALAEYRAAAAMLPDEPSAARASILAGEAHILMLQGEAPEARAPCEEAVRIARQVGAAEVECDALNTLGAVLTMLGAPEQASEPLRRGMLLAEELGALEELRRAYINLTQMLDEAGRLDEAAELGRDGWALLRPRIGTAALYLAAEAGLRFTRLGRWEEALALLQEAADSARHNTLAGMVQAALAEITAQRGELDQARVHLRSATDLLAEDFVYWTLTQGAAASEVALAAGHPEELRQIVDPDAPLPAVYPAYLVPLHVLALRAEATLAQQARFAGDEPAEHTARSRAQGLLSRVRAMVTPETWPLGPTPRETLLEAELCELETQRTCGQDRADDWSRLAMNWEALDRPPRAAYARLREGQAALAEQLPRTRIADALTTARATAASLGAQPLLDEIELIARRARVRSGDRERDVPAEVAELTSRELDVLRLIAEGRTNPEIGKLLYMSPKTASVHVSRILSKLGVKTRTEAAGVAYRLGLLDTPNRQIAT